MKSNWPGASIRTAGQLKRQRHRLNRRGNKQMQLSPKWPAAQPSPCSSDAVSVNGV
jgi:hypothetical protein